MVFGDRIGRVGDPPPTTQLKFSLPAISWYADQPNVAVILLLPRFLHSLTQTLDYAESFWRSATMVLMQRRLLQFPSVEN